MGDRPMTISSPEIAVIMPALNAARTIRPALQSLMAQSVPCEAALVDGGSTDDTVAIASAVPGLRVISAPGASIYEAINRGIEATTAPAICLLNLDDILLPGAAAAFVEALDRNPRMGIVRGWPCFVEQGADGAVSVRADADRRTHLPLSLELLLRGPCAINSLCVRRATFDRVGMFDTGLRLAADREWMLRAWRASVGIAEIDRPVYRYLMHEGSKTLDRGRRNYTAIRREHLAIIAAQLGRPSGSEPRFMSALGRWHAAEAAMLSLSLVRAGSWMEAARVVSGAFRVRPSWPATLAGDILLHVTGGRRA
jgi:glycosyltransferase involved in cell wall biosynthesis